MIVELDFKHLVSCTRTFRRQAYILLVKKIANDIQTSVFERGSIWVCSGFGFNTRVLRRGIFLTECG